jgi:hypothetical protein
MMMWYIIEEKRLDNKEKKDAKDLGWSSEEQSSLILPFVESVFGAMRLGSSYVMPYVTIFIIYIYITIINHMLCVVCNSRARYLVPRVMELVSQCPRDSKVRHCWLTATSGVCDQMGRQKELAVCKCKGTQAYVPCVIWHT